MRTLVIRRCLRMGCGEPLAGSLSPWERWLEPKVAAPHADSAQEEASVWSFPSGPVAGSGAQDDRQGRK